MATKLLGPNRNGRYFYWYRGAVKKYLRHQGQYELKVWVVMAKVVKVLHK